MEIVDAQHHGVAPRDANELDSEDYGKCLSKRTAEQQAQPVTAPSPTHWREVNLKTLDMHLSSIDNQVPTSLGLKTSFRPSFFNTLKSDFSQKSREFQDDTLATPYQFGRVPMSNESSTRPGLAHRSQAIHSQNKPSREEDATRGAS